MHITHKRQSLNVNMKTHLQPILLAQCDVRQSESQ